MDIIKLLLALALAFPVNAVYFPATSHAGSDQTFPDDATRALLNESNNPEPVSEDAKTGKDCSCCKLKKKGQEDTKSEDKNPERPDDK